MRRRELIVGLGSAVAWPLLARAQQRQMPVVGFLNGAYSSRFNFLAAAFRQGLFETGFVETRNVAIEYRWGDGRDDRISEFAAELVQRRVSVIAATGGAGDNVSVVKTVAAAIPIVFLTGNDPIELGLVTSINRPEGNITGVSFFLSLLGGKRLELLAKVVPTATKIGVLSDPSFPQNEAFLKDLQVAAVALGRKLQVIPVTTGPEIDTAFGAIAEQHLDALLVSPDPLFIAQRERIVTLATNYAVPVIYQVREFPVIGGLMSYGTSIVDAYRQVGVYAGRILKGEKPADLPVIQPTKFELVINLKTAKALGLTIPETLLATADEVIQ
jgi:putative tryptophan/tyrosine transport system substrate-binding protein